MSHLVLWYNRYVISLHVARFQERFILQIIPRAVETESVVSRISCEDECVIF